MNANVAFLNVVTLTLMLTVAFCPVQAWSTNQPMKMGLVGSVSKGARRVRDSLLNKERSREDLKIGIAGFYDRSSKLWEDVWGEVSHFVTCLSLCCTVAPYLRYCWGVRRSSVSRFPCNNLTLSFPTS
jgi:hypothetical protein